VLKFLRYYGASKSDYPETILYRPVINFILKFIVKSFKCLTIRWGGDNAGIHLPPITLLIIALRTHATEYVEVPWQIQGRPSMYDDLTKARVNI